MTGVGVFVKFPEPGKVKTRLAESVGAEKACTLYTKMIDHVLDKTLRPSPYPYTFFCDPFRPEQDYRRFFSQGDYAIEMQEGKDLGERLLQASKRLLSRYSYALIIGTDCLDITPAILEEASMGLLSGRDLILGPAQDGGYYLIGVNRVRPELFSGIEWSSSRVFDQTMNKAKGLNTHFLPMLSDIDTLDDLKTRAREKGGRVDGNAVLANLVM